MAATNANILENRLAHVLVKGPDGGEKLRAFSHVVAVAADVAQWTKVDLGDQFGEAMYFDVRTAQCMSGHDVTFYVSNKRKVPFVYAVRLGARMQRTNRLAFFYFTLGVLLNLAVALPTELYLIDRGADVVELSRFNALLVVPWCLKPLYGFVSDTMPLCGERRRPYIVATNAVCCLLWTYAYANDMSLAAAKALFFAASMLLCFSDVMMDSILVVLAKDEREHGIAQTTCWMARSVGSLLTALLSGVLVTQMGYRPMFGLQAAVHCAVAVAAPLLLDRDLHATRRGQCVADLRALQKAARRPQIYRPALFMLLFACTPSSATAFFYFLVRELHFSPTTLGVLGAVTHGAMLLGTLMYRKCFRDMPLRRYLCYVVVLSAVLGTSPLILVTHFNRTMHLPDAVFVSGDDLFLGIASKLAILPILVLIAKLCPQGVEASLYAAFVALLNFGGVVSEYGGAALAAALHVSSENFEQLPVLIVVCTSSTLLALVLLPLVPKGNIAHVVDAQEEAGYASADTIDSRDYDADDDASDEVPCSSQSSSFAEDAVELHNFNPRKEMVVI